MNRGAIWQVITGVLLLLIIGALSAYGNKCSFECNQKCSFADDQVLFADDKKCSMTDDLLQVIRCSFCR